MRFVDGDKSNVVMTVCTVAASSSVVVERVANYSSVTARESLENLRRRQQQERRRRTGLLMSDDIDTTYDTIDYDVINSVTFSLKLILHLFDLLCELVILQVELKLAFYLSEVCFYTDNVLCVLRV